MALTLVCSYHTDPVHFFDDNTRKPCTGLCGHTVCLQCITLQTVSKCPACGLNGAFDQISVNYASIALFQDCRKRFFEKLKEWVNKKNRCVAFCSKLFEETQVLCSICVEPVKIPRICLTCDREIFFQKNTSTWAQSSAIILTLLQRVMCSNCAIDNHGGHDIKKHSMDKKLKKLIMMALAQKALDMFKDAIENKNGVIDCFLRRLKIGKIGQNLLRVIEELKYVEEWECGYLGELIKKELIKKYMENVDEKVLDLFGTEGNVCDCSRYHEKPKTFPRNIVDVKVRRVGMKPQIFASGCPFHSWKMASEFPGDAETTSTNEIDCPLCVYKGYRQHQKQDFLLENGVSIIGEICKAEMIPLEKCCLKCLDRLNDCELFLSCDHLKEERPTLSRTFSMWYREKKRYETKKTCYQNCFIKDSTLWNFVIINHMMTDNNLYDVIIHEIEQTNGFVDCQLQKIRLKETVNDLYFGLNSVRFREYFDHLSTPIEMAALFESFKQQWSSFRNGNGEQEAASQCKCTSIWNKVLEKKVEKEEYEDMEAALINMTRYSMTEDIHGCPMEYNHGIELNKDVMDELKNTVGFESTGQETELTLGENEQVNCLMENISSNIFPFAHLHCQNEKEQLFDNEIHKPYTGSCGHTICSVCIEEILSGECPVCGMEKSFEGSKLNEDLLQEVETIKRNAWGIFKELWSNEAADFTTCSKCKKYSSDLYICEIVNLIWYSGSGIETMADVLTISRHILCQRCASVQAEKVYPILFWKNYLKKTNGIFLLELLDITDIINGIRKRRGDNLEFRRVEILIKLLKELNYKYKDSCGYDRELIKLKLIDKLVQSNNQTIKQLFMREGNPYKPIKGCPLCVMVDFRECAENIEHDCNNWMNVFEHLWNIQSVKFEKCCIRCLLYLNDRYSELCQTVTETSFFKTMSTIISEGIEVNVLNCFLESGFYGLQRYWDEYFTDCKDCNLLVDDKEIWQNLIIREYFLCLIQIVISGVYKTDFACHLRKIRIHNLVYHLLLEICDVWGKHNQYWSVWWRFIKASSKLEDLKIQFKKLREEMDEEEFEDEEFEDECECTDIWERNQYMMRKFGHDEHEKRKRYEDLEESMEEMAKFSLEEDLDGCPMKYNHGIGLDEEAVINLKESIVPEEETSENECLCDVVESIESKTAISSRADIEHAVSFFINWWRYEASYPHVLCYICMNDLEFIQHHLSTLPGFYNCELRKTRMLKTFDCLLVHIRHFQLRKVRVSKSEMEEMTGVFDSFISQWNFFQFGSDSDQRPLSAGTVCHCTRTLDTTRSLQYAKEEEYTSFMIVSNELAAFNLEEIITGCPLEFDNDIDDACFDPEGISNETYRCFKLMFCDST